MSAGADTLVPRGLTELAGADVGGEALLCSDDFFAGMENLLKSGRGQWYEGEYTEQGKRMDGWESRRRRTPGHDWCILRLGIVGEVLAVDIQTDHFTGNYPPFASVEACHAPGASAEALRDEVSWTRIVPEVVLRGGSTNFAVAAERGTWTHLRLNIYPAGGVARLRVYGHPQRGADTGRMDLACSVNGGRVLWASDMYFADMANLIRPEPATDMGQGWETRRSRPPGEDALVLALGRPGRVEEVVVDTAFFKGNYPEKAQLEALYWPEAPPHALLRNPHWTPIVPWTRLGPHEQRTLPVSRLGTWTHLRLRISPDGGISRLRVLGVPDDAAPEAGDPLLQRLNSADEAEAAELFATCCGAARWVAGMVAARPFRSRAELFGVAEQVWWHLDEADWREAFTHHPEIGADVAKLRERFTGTAHLSETEQAGVAGASEATLQALAKGNRLYKSRFGFIFIVCASGKTAFEMLSLLEERIDNDPAAELRIAAGEQAKITALRLDGLT